MRGMHSWRSTMGATIDLVEVTALLEAELPKAPAELSAVAVL